MRKGLKDKITGEFKKLDSKLQILSKHGDIFKEQVLNKIASFIGVNNTTFKTNRENLWNLIKVELILKEFLVKRGDTVDEYDSNDDSSRYEYDEYTEDDFLREIGELELDKKYHKMYDRTNNDKNNYLIKYKKYKQKYLNKKYKYWLCSVTIISLLVKNPNQQVNFIIIPL